MEIGSSVLFTSGSKALTVSQIVGPNERNDTVLSEYNTADHSGRAV
jgi:hypothetical protein